MWKRSQFFWCCGIGHNFFWSCGIGHNFKNQEWNWSQSQMLRLERMQHFSVRINRIVSWFGLSQSLISSAIHCKSKWWNTGAKQWFSQHAASICTDNTGKQESSMTVVLVQTLALWWENHCLAPVFHHLDLQCRQWLELGGPYFEVKISSPRLQLVS